LPKMNCRRCPFCGTWMLSLGRIVRDLGIYKDINITIYECKGCDTIIPIANVEDLVVKGALPGKGTLS
jgi:hypothetical protein